MKADAFKKEIAAYIDEFAAIVATESGEWTVKGFIDVHKKIYTISLDTKVVSKIVELTLFPVIARFAKEHDYEMILSSHQNHYPDVSSVCKRTRRKIALDLKSTYRLDAQRVNGMTLGAFTGYFRQRRSAKNATFPYGEYDKHYVLGVIYSKTDLHNAEKALTSLGVNVSLGQRKLLVRYLSSHDEDAFAELVDGMKTNAGATPSAVREAVDACVIDEKTTHSLDDLARIISVVRDFEFFLQEKWRIAIDRLGSGNTKNIGSTCSIKELKSGTAIFTRQKNGKAVFDDYWMHYMTRDMARAVDLEQAPYTNLSSYVKYKGSPHG